jgi:hypothetical protein
MKTETKHFYHRKIYDTAVLEWDAQFYLRIFRYILSCLVSPCACR